MMEKTILSSNGLPKHVQVQRASLVNDDTAFIEAIPAIVFAVVISYVYLNVGTYMNGTLGSELVASYPGNTKTGSIDTDLWYNASADGSYTINLSDTNTVEQLDQTISKIFIHATGASDLYYNLSVNGVSVNASSFFNNSEAYNHTVSSLITGGSLFNGNTTLTYTWNSSTTDVSVELRTYGTYYTSTDQRTTLENNSANTLNNISSHFDDNVNIIKIAITISILLVPIMAIMSFRRFT